MLQKKKCSRSRKLLQDSGDNGGKDPRKALKKMKSIRDTESLEDLAKLEKKSLKKKKDKESSNFSGLEPNYMRSTVSSETKRREIGKIVVIDDTKGRGKPIQKPVKILTRRVSLAARPSTWKKSLSIGVGRATCSSAIRNFKSPNYLDRDSFVPLCSFSYCSLNSHHHQSNLPPLRRFLAGRRRLAKCHSAQLRAKWSIKNKKFELGEDELFLELFGPEMKKIEGNTNVIDPVCGLPPIDINVSNVKLQVENPVHLDDDLPRGNDLFICYDEMIQPFNRFTPYGNLQEITFSGSNSPLSENILLEDDDDAKYSNSHLYHNGVSQPSDGSYIKDKLLDITFSKTMNSPHPGVIPPEDHDTAKDINFCLDHAEVIQPGEGTAMKDKLQGNERESTVITLSGSMKENDPITKRPMIEIQLEERSFNPRPPSFLPENPKVIAEKVFLRHQSMEERMNRDEWMVDYALQRAVDKLALEQRNRVESLIEVFEAVIPHE